MPCPECGGAGSSYAGSFGTIPCPGCNGARFVDHPSMYGAEPHPGVAKIRAMTTAFRHYAYLLDEYNEGDSADPPSRDGVPTVAEVKKMTKRLAKAAPDRSLPAGSQRERLEDAPQRRRIVGRVEDDEDSEDWGGVRGDDYDDDYD